MYAVIRHTFEMVRPEPDNPKSLKTYAEWRHFVWIFEAEIDAMSFAITLLDSPLLLANDHYLAHAIESLQTNRYWQMGKESVAVGDILDSPEIVYEEFKDERRKNDFH
jgi:hypothetical protein